MIAPFPTATGRGDPRTWALCAYLGAAMVLGGGGSPSPAPEAALQVLAGALLLIWVWAGRGNGLPAIPRVIQLLVAALLLPPVMQLIPLPPVIWHDLPGRSLQYAGLELVGLHDTWRPLSIAPGKTLVATLALVPPLIVLSLGSQLAPQAIIRCLRTIGIVGIAAAILGLAQIGTGITGLRLYQGGHDGWLTGFHANRNAAADMLLVAACAWAASCATGMHNRQVQDTFTKSAMLAPVLLLLLATILTGSRLGIALVLPALLAVIVMMPYDPRRSVAGYLIASIAALTITGAIVLAWRGGVVADRFSLVEDTRWALWDDGVPAIAAFWPWGSGLGTFQEAFLPFERLQHVDASLPNRMHNEYLEYLLEAGLLGLLAMLVAAACLARLLIGCVRRKILHEPPILFAWATIVFISVHGMVDYPLRNMANATLLAFAVAVLTVGLREAQGRADHNLCRQEG